MITGAVILFVIHAGILGFLWRWDRVWLICSAGLGGLFALIVGVHVMFP